MYSESNINFQLDPKVNAVSFRHWKQNLVIKLDSKSIFSNPAEPRLTNLKTPEVNFLPAAYAQAVSSLKVRDSGPVCA